MVVDNVMAVEGMCALACGLTMSIADGQPQLQLKEQVGALEGASMSLNRWSTLASFHRTIRLNWLFIQ